MSHLSEENLDEMIARERATERPPLNSWQTIAAGLREEGLIRGPAQGRWTAQPWLRAAAAVVLVAGGIAFGRTSAPRDPVGPGASSVPQTAAQVPSGQAVSSAVTPAFRSADEAWETLNRAGAEYQRASAYLATVNSGAQPRVDSASLYASRLAALEQVMSATQSALEQAPRDPVINQYYLATMGAREATRQQLARPAGLRLTGF
ncbi:MAG TPA: hypothetical protein VNJ04_06010 [Gemmatimonadaceae bacterium]|nr:hypothetical protein [Gemmatimonadaceae bacterium]